MKNQSFGYLTALGNYKLSETVTIPGNRKRKRFAYQIIGGQLFIEYNKEWYKINKSDFKAD